MRLALDQWMPVSGKAEGLARLDDAAARAAQAGAEMLVLPEMALTGYAIGAEAVRQAAEPLDGPMGQAMAAAARRHGLAIVVGLPEANGNHVYNTALMVGADGTRLGSYRKTHLFGMVDRAQFSPGAAPSPIIDWNGWKIALAICYDAEFPELIRSYALAGADLVLVPTANMEPYDGIATRMMPARAEENEIYLAYANQCGPEADFVYNGLSCVLGPDGEDLARAGRAPEMITAVLSRDALAETRARLSHLADRRPDLYS